MPGPPPTAAGGPDPPVVRKLLSFRVLINVTPHIVFWLPEEEVLGITDGKERLFETPLSTADRQTFAGNVSQSVLEDKWATLFKNRAITFKFLDDDLQAEAKCIRQSKVLLRPPETAKRNRIAQVLLLAVELMTTLHKKLAAIEEKQKVDAIERKRMRFPSHQAPPTRRAKTQPTGLAFGNDDDDDEDGDGEH